MARIRYGKVPEEFREKFGQDIADFMDELFREIFGPAIGERGTLDRNNVTNVENLQTGESNSLKVLRATGDGSNVAFSDPPGLLAKYVVLEADSELPNDRVATGGTNITVTEDATNGLATWDVSPQGAGSLLDSDLLDGREAAQFVWSIAKSGDTALQGVDVTLSEGSNITLTQVGSDIEIAASGGGGAPVGAQYLVLVADGTLTDERVFTPGTSLSVTDNGAGLAYDVNTVQDIRTSASPTFTGLTLSGFGTGVVQSSAGGVLSSSTLSHTSLSDIGTNTHAAIDTHIADTTIHFTEGSIDHGSISGLGDDDHTIYALLAGRASGQTLIGGTAAGEDLTLQSTSNATRGSIFLGSAANSQYDEVNDRLGINTTPTVDLDVDGMILATHDSTITSGDENAGEFIITSTPGATSTGTYTALVANSSTNDTSALTSGTIQGANITASHGQTALVGTLLGANLFNDITGSASTNLQYGIQLAASCQSNGTGATLSRTVLAGGGALFKYNVNGTSSTQTIGFGTGFGLDNGLFQGQLSNNTATRTISRWSGITSDWIFNAGATGTTITDLYGVWITDPGSTGPTITNQYQLNMESPTRSGVICVRQLDTSGNGENRLQSQTLIGANSAPATSAVLELQSTTGALIVSRMTTTQRNALTAVNGMIIYNSTTNEFNFRENGSWVTGSGLA